MFATHIVGKELISRISKELLKCNKKKQKQPFIEKKLAKGIGIRSS